jgi:cytosine permease
MSQFDVKNFIKTTPQGQNMFSDDYSTQPVPENFKHSAFWLANIIVGIGICLPVFVFGGELASQLPFMQLVIALLLGGVATGILMGLTSGVGASTRLSATLLGRKIFGRVGGQALMISVIMTSLGWWGVQLEIMSDILNTVLKSSYDIDIGKEVITIVIGLLMISTTIIGAQAIGKLSILAVPLMFIMLLIPLFLIPDGPSIDKLINHNIETPASLGLMVAGMMGGWMSGVVVMPDFGRFTASFKTAFTGALSACVVGMTILMGLSAFLSIWLDAPNFILAYPAMGLGLIAIVVIILSTWTSNDNNLYAAVLPVATATKAISRPLLSLGFGLLGIGLCVFGIFSQFISWLVLNGILMSPIAACIISYYFLARTELSWDTTEKNFKSMPLIAWAIGSCVGYVTSPAAVYGLELFTITTAPPLDSFIVTGVIISVYLLIKRNKVQNV